MQSQDTPTQKQGKRKRGESFIFLRGKIWWMRCYSGGRSVTRSTRSQDRVEANAILLRECRRLRRWPDSRDELSTGADIAKQLRAAVRRVRRQDLQAQDAGHWITLRNNEDAPAFSGCYAITDGSRAFYVGQSINIAIRLKSHGWKISPDGIETKWGFIRGGKVKTRVSRVFSEHLMVEARLIRKLKPLFNKTVFI